MTIAARGSEWHRWEPHIHAPGTVLEDRYPASTGLDAYLHALETASPPLLAIGITDYCITRSYERLKAEKKKGRLKGCSLLFPNIELRLNTGTVKGHFVNIHLLVCPDDPNHIAELNRFLGQLVFSAFNDKFVRTPSDLIRLGRRADPSKTEDESALRHGCTQFKVSLDNLIDAHRMTWAADNVLIAVAGNADGTSGIKDAADATLREEIERAAHAIFASSLKQRDFWLGHGKASVNELRERYGGQKPCIWGSDAHELAHAAKPADDRFCWIKGAPTFDTLKQACIDPERAYIPTTRIWSSMPMRIRSSLPKSAYTQLRDYRQSHIGPADSRRLRFEGSFATSWKEANLHSGIVRVGFESLSLARHSPRGGELTLRACRASGSRR